MKKLIISLLIIFQAAAVFAQESITEEGKRFRNDIMIFLREEGFSPTIDNEDHDLQFKKEGKLYWIYFYDSSPIYIQFFKVGENTKSYSVDQILRIANEANYKEEAKVYRSSMGNTMFLIEAYCHSSEEFKYAFYKYMKALDDTRQFFLNELDKIDGGTSNKPFSIYSCDMANVTADNTIINDYGQKIYSSSSRYIIPKIWVTTTIEGKYDIYVKFYSPNGLSTGTSSPAGYSYKNTISLSKNESAYFLSSWGNDTPGFWSSGNYRIEFYYDGNLLYTKSFTVY